MACCVLMAAIWCAALGLKAWLTGAYRRPGRAAQDWRLTAQDDRP
jgi:hypothetical protein